MVLLAMGDLTVCCPFSALKVLVWVNAWLNALQRLPSSSLLLIGVNIYNFFHSLLLNIATTVIIHCNNHLIQNGILFILGKIWSIR